MPVGANPADRHEQITTLDMPRVVSDPAHLDFAIAFEGGRGHTARQVFELHVRFAA